ncbi:MAG TPA: DsbA family protein, partial [Acidimicrobiales bacterium]|nr:DsbA family protein [Acidimicrobiales bacterium]
VHLALFSARHDQGRDLRVKDVVRDVLAESGADAEAVMAAIADGGPLEEFRKAHQSSVEQHDAWGVPTFIVGDRAAFVRIMTRPEGDARASIDLIDRIVDAVGTWSEVNELKHTSLAR